LSAAGASAEGPVFEDPVVEDPVVEDAVFGSPARNLKLGRSSSDIIASYVRT
jgi:hypothetical protein